MALRRQRARYTGISTHLRFPRARFETTLFGGSALCLRADRLPEGRFGGTLMNGSSGVLHHGGRCGATAISTEEGDWSECA